MPSPRIVEAIDVLEDCQFRVSSRVPRPAPDQLCLDGLEERLNGGVVVTIALAAHGYLEAMLAQDLRARPVNALWHGVCNSCYAA